MVHIFFFKILKDEKSQNGKKIDVLLLIPLPIHQLADCANSHC